MAVTEVTEEGWGSRLGKSFGGVIVGIILFFGSIALLWWNEGRAVTTAKALAEGEGNVVAVKDISKVDSANAGKLVHMSGEAATTETLTDPTFALSKNAIGLSRKVEYYQWVEHKSEKREKQMGGSEKVITTYTYSKEWVSSPQDSSAYKEAGHENRVFMTLPGDCDVRAKEVSFGAFKLTSGQISRIGGEEPVSLEEYTIPVSMANNAEVQGGNTLYLHMNPGRVVQPVATTVPAPVEGQPVAQPVATTVPAPVEGQPVAQPVATTVPAPVEGQPVAQPVQQPTIVFDTEAQIGDMRVQWSFVAPQRTISLVAVQVNNTFEPYTAEDGGGEVDLLTDGVKSAKAMFNDAKSANTMLTWILRVVGFFAMFIGLSMLVAPLEVICDVLPFLGNIVGAVSKGVCFIIALVISLLDIALAWLFYRPVIGIILLAAVAGVIYLAKKARSKKAAPAPAAPAEPQS
ncbi:MAG: TMEM43 family protein [Akkermansia muciniphila]|nr:TMEM43 family protein [Akkermansia muciniphila]